MVALDGRVAKAVFGLSSYMTEKMQHVTKSEYLLTRCPAGTEARLRGSGSCFCGTETMGAQSCLDQKDKVSGMDSICVEDLRGFKRQPTCGIEYYDEPPLSGCPISYVRVPSGATTLKSQLYICQSTASVHSCGKTQRDCTQTSGTLAMACVMGECEIERCNEGFRFKILKSGVAACVVSRPLFFET